MAVTAAVTMVVVVFVAMALLVVVAVTVVMVMSAAAAVIVMGNEHKNRSFALILRKLYRPGRGKSKFLFFGPYPRPGLARRRKREYNECRIPTSSGTGGLPHGKQPEGS
jgi:type IV secretory pathway VirB3-like protein